MAIPLQKRLSPSKDPYIKKWDPAKSSFKPKEPTPADKILPKDKDAAFIKAAKTLGVTPTTKPSGREQFNKLFGESNMNPDSIANQIIREAFTGGARANVTKGNDNSAPGQTSRQMLAGEWVGSTAWPFDQATNPMFKGSTELQATQAERGMGVSPGTGKFGESVENVGRDIADALLEDTPEAMFTDPSSVGYLINSLSEAGYQEYADKCEKICEGYTTQDILEVADMIDALETAKADSFLIEQLTKFADLLLDENDAGGTPTEDAGETAGAPEEKAAAGEEPSTSKE